VTGAAARAHDGAEATRIVKLLLEDLGMPKGRVALSGRAKWQREKSLICWIVRKRTGVANEWLADRLSMGHVSSVTRSLRRVRETKGWIAEAERLEQMLEI
jgi:murein endopeptidase